MNVAVVLEHRFVRTPDGRVWTKTFFARSFWQRYLSVFDGVRVIARVRRVDHPPEDVLRVDSDQISVSEVPAYVGPLQYAMRIHAVRSALRRALHPEEALILRVSSQLANIVEPIVRRAGHPYAVEVVADPADVFRPGSVKHPLRPFFHWWFPKKLRAQCQRAVAAAYVTENMLQRSYPPGPNTFMTHYSSVELRDESFVEEPRKPFSVGRSIKLLMVGTLEQLYKAPDVLLDALAICLRRGEDLELTFVGEGRMTSALQKQANDLGIAARVRFVGSVTSGAAVREWLDKSDLFVLPSRQEGLPRAMVEAMARGLPCIGSAAGGIPELLRADEVVPVANAEALALKISEVVADQDRMAAMSERNLRRSRDFHESELCQRRMAMYRHLYEATLAVQSKRRKATATATGLASARGKGGW